MKRILSMAVLAALAGCAATPPGPPPPAIPVFFEPWSAALDDHALSAIAAAAQQARATPGTTVVVTGAADSTGSSTANRYISKTRAQVVADQLAADGIDPSDIKVRGVGTVSAPTQNSTPAQYARRVLIQIGGPAPLF